MCRVAAYVGREPVRLAALLYDPPHSLQHAAYAPRELLRGSVNVDGTGVAWWPPSDTAPLRYVTDKPPWADVNLPGLADALTGTTIVAAVRSATPGLAFGPGNVAPYVVDGFAGVHNGWIGDFRGEVGRRLIDRLSTPLHAELVARNDSLALVLLVAQQLRDAPGVALADAVRAALAIVAEEVRAGGATAMLNLVIGRGPELVAARTSVDEEINSLYLRRDHGAVWLASEPLDPDEAWEPVADDALLTITADGVHEDTLAEVVR